jgi:ferritin
MKDGIRVALNRRINHELAVASFSLSAARYCALINLAGFVR